MVELEFLGATDGRLVFTDPNGERYLVSPSPELAAAFRAISRPQAHPHPKQKLGLSEIQMRLRAGETVSALAAQSDLSESAIETFAYPIIAERQYIASKATQAVIGEGGPTLGDLVIDRLAARGIDTGTLEWDATRMNNDPWQIHLTFVQDAQVKEANWDFFDGRVEALDEEARWLSETIAPSGRQHLVQLYQDKESAAQAPQETEVSQPAAGTEALLESLQRARGKRQSPYPEDFTEELDLEAEAELREVALSQQTPVPPAQPRKQERKKQRGTRAKLYALSSGQTQEPQESTPANAAPAATQVAAAADTAVATGNKAAEAAGAESASAPVTTVHPGQETIDLPGMDGGVEAPKKRAESKRRSVPSWDEIVFGPRDPEN